MVSFLSRWPHPFTFLDESVCMYLTNFLCKFFCYLKIKKRGSCLPLKFYKKKKKPTHNTWVKYWILSLLWIRQNPDLWRLVCFVFLTRKLSTQARQGINMYTAFWNQRLLLRGGSVPVDIYWFSKQKIKKNENY